MLQQGNKLCDNTTILLSFQIVEFSEIGHKQDVICKPDDIRWCHVSLGATRIYSPPKAVWEVLVIA